MINRLVLPCLALMISAIGTNRSLAHPGHAHTGRDNLAPIFTSTSTESKMTAQPTPETEMATTGAGDLQFRYHADASLLPPEIADKILPAHGGFAKLPNGEVYFGLPEVGLIHMSADLMNKTVLTTSDEVRSGDLHNTTYARHQGQEVLILPDPGEGQIHFLKLNGETLATLGRPAVNDYYRAEENPYKPTDTQVGPDGSVYICDGYSAGKYVLKADLDLSGTEATATFRDDHFGGPSGKKGVEGRAPGKFSTNHGITLSEDEQTLLVSDREHHWVQRLTPDGEFIEGIDVGGGNPCDVDFVEFQGESLMVVGCLRGEGNTAGVVQLLRKIENKWTVVSTLQLKKELGLEAFEHIHNAAGIVVDGKLYILCYGWNPGCYAVLEHIL